MIQGENYLYSNSSLLNKHYCCFTFFKYNYVFDNCNQLYHIMFNNTEYQNTSLFQYNNCFINNQNAVLYIDDMISILVCITLKKNLH